MIIAIDAATTHAEDASANLHKIIAEVGQRTTSLADALQIAQAQAACSQAWALVALARVAPPVAGRATLVGCAACGASLDDDNCDDAETHVCAPREK